jgi:hypothetical protein
MNDNWVLEIMVDCDDTDTLYENINGEEIFEGKGDGV